MFECSRACRDMFFPFSQYKKKFVSQAYFCLFKQNSERKKFSAYNKKFPTYIKKKKKKRSAYEMFYAACKQGFNLIFQLIVCVKVEQKFQCV